MLAEDQTSLRSEAGYEVISSTEEPVPPMWRCASCLVKYYGGEAAAHCCQEGV